MVEDSLRKIAGVTFQKEVLDTARRLYEIERPFGFEAFEQSARFCCEKLREAGADDVELMEFPADGRADYWDKRLPLAWYPEYARLEVTRPGRAFADPVIADLARSPFHLAMWSASTPPGGVHTEIVTENMMRAGHSVEGKLVLANPYKFPKTIYRAVCDRGGLGIVGDFVRDPFVTPDGLFWVNSFQESPEWFHGADNRDLLGLCVTPRVGRRLRELLVSGTVRAHVEVRTRKEPGTLYAATGTIRGAELPDEEVWLAAHLCEPLGCDNSPGAAAAITALSVLAELIRKGELPRPRRTIRAAMTLELYGFSAMLKTLAERGKKLATTFVMDGVTFRPSASGLPCDLFLSPDANPLFSHEPVKRAVEMCLEPRGEVWRKLNAGNSPTEKLAYRYVRGYFGNDAFLGDPMAGGPSFHLHKGGGPYWHNSENDFGKVWPELLSAMTAMHAGLAHYLCCLGPDDAPRLSELVEAESRQYLSESYLRFLRGGQTAEPFARALHLRTDMVHRRLANLSGWTGESAAAIRTRVDAFATDLLEKAGANAIDPFGYEPDELSKIDRRARTVVFRRMQPTFPMSQAFVEDPRDRRELTAGLDNVLARMDGEKHLLRILEEEEYFSGHSLNRRGILSDCLFLAEHGYLQAEFTEVVTRDELVAGLRDAGVREGDLVFAHSSVSAFGHVQGGADAVVDALLQAVGPEGTVLVPTFTSGTVKASGMLYRGLNVDPFHQALTRVWTGAVPRAFLKRPGVVRSSHPSHSVAGIGPLAEQCLRDQRADHPAVGATSAFAHLAELGAKIVYVGASPLSSTFLHYLETKLELPYLMKRLGCVRGEDGRVEYVFSDGHVGGHRDFYRADWRGTKVFSELLAAGLQVSSACVGLGEVLLVGAAEFERLGLEALRADPTILLCDAEDCLFCRQAKARCAPAS